MPKCKFCDFSLPRLYRPNGGPVRHYYPAMEAHLAKRHAPQLTKAKAWAEAASTVPPRTE